MNKKTINYCKELLKNNKIKEISPTLFEVENHSVKFQKKQSRTLLICDCCNDTRFCVESPICCHKLAVINFIFNKSVTSQSNKLIKLYETWKEIKMPVTIDFMINDLKNIRDGFT